MKALVPIINAFSSGLKAIVMRNRIPKKFSSANLALSSPTLMVDEVFNHNNSCCVDDDLLPNIKCIPAEYMECNGLSSGGNDIFAYVDKDSPISENEKAVDYEMEIIKVILTNRGWNLGSQNGYRIDLSQFNVMKILNDLFEESTDAALALYFFRWSEYCMGSKHTVESVCTMIHILVSGNMNHKAMDLLLRLISHNSGEEGWHNIFLKIHETHTKRRVLETVYGMLVNCYVKENMTQVALKLICKMRHLNIFPLIGVCNSLLKALLESEQLNLAWDFLKEMKSRGIGLNASIISLFISGYCNQGNIDTGWKLLMEMKYLGIKPDVVAYTIVIDSLCKMSLLKEATSILFKMTQMGVFVDSVSVSSVVDGYCKVGKSEEAMDVLEVFNLSPNIFVFNSFISKLCTDGNMLKAAKVFQDMCEMGLMPDCFSYTTMMAGYCKVKDISNALKYLGKMLKRGIRPSVATYTLLIDSCCKPGNMEMAEYLFQRMITEGLVPDVVSYNTLMNGYGKKGHLQKAFELLSMMRSAGVSPDLVSYNILIHGLIKRGLVNEAKDILDELMRRGFSPDVVTFTNIIGGFSNKGNFEEAFLLFFYMSEHHLEPDVVTCSALLNGYCRARHMAEANVLFHKMLDAGLKADVILYNSLIHGFCSLGNIDDACHLVSMMIEHGIMPNNITHHALVLGYEKKCVENPVERAAFKLQQLLLKYGIQAEDDR